jgi:Uncharacterized conserved protein
MTTPDPALAPWRDGVCETLRLRVTPRAKDERWRLDEDGRGAVLRLWVTAPPADGAATAAALRLAARAIGRPPTALTLAKGAASRDKLVRIAPVARS